MSQKEHYGTKRNKSIRQLGLNWFQCHWVGVNNRQLDRIDSLHWLFILAIIWIHLFSLRITLKVPKPKSCKVAKIQNPRGNRSKNCNLLVNRMNKWPHQLYCSQLNLNQQVVKLWFTWKETYDQMGENSHAFEEKWHFKQTVLRKARQILTSSILRSHDCLSCLCWQFCGTKVLRWYKTSTWVQVCLWTIPGWSILVIFKSTLSRVTTPLLVHSLQFFFRRYAVRKGSVRTMQKSWYIVRRHQFFHQETQQMWHTKSNNSKLARSLCLRFFWSFKHL